MMKTKKLMTFLSLGLLIAACSHEPSMKYSENVDMETVAETADANSISSEEGSLAPKTNTDLLSNLKIIKNAQCRFKVADIDSAVQKARAIVTQHGGYISDMRYQHTNYHLENRFTVRVPQEDFEPVMQQLITLAEFVDFNNVTTKDVSEEYIDLQTRLKTKQEVKARYDEILRSKAKTVEEVLLTEEKLRVLQEEIEAAQGRLKFLSNKVALSTIQVDLYAAVAHKAEPEVYTQTYGSKMKESLSFGWELLSNLFLGLLYIWPFILLTTGIILFFRFRKK
ncbi:DUF4349 domain-containing protein [Sungkyunkwania multivorans]|uniref:DUF4349 domain-containing protein n=1 Tax=Sungkyunkwania multivorans TaxID=1173618 RepID=A0ABW3D0U4_9FLAO